MLESLCFAKVRNPLLDFSLPECVAAEESAFNDTSHHPASFENVVLATMQCMNFRAESGREEKGQK